MQPYSDPEMAIESALEILAPVVRPGTTVVTPLSGGKDSTLAAQVVLLLIKRGKLPKPARLILPMADTLMEYPQYWKAAIDRTLRMEHIGQNLGIDTKFLLCRGRPQRDFWVMILGWGFAPPTTNRRYCTHDLKISATQQTLTKLRLYWDESTLGGRDKDKRTNPFLLGVRYDESAARREAYFNDDGTKGGDGSQLMIPLVADMPVQKQPQGEEFKPITCTMGGECGPDTWFRKIGEDRRFVGHLPIAWFKQCALWDTLNYIMPGELGVDNSGLRAAYGPDGDLRYGCWSCPLIYDDKTGRYLARHNRSLYDLVTFIGGHFRKGGAAWKNENREVWLGSDGRLSLAYCKRTFLGLLRLEKQVGFPLLEDWQKQQVHAAWDWRENEPESVAGQQAQLVIDLYAKSERPQRIGSIKTRTAKVLAEANLVDRAYERDVQESAKALVDHFPDEVWTLDSVTGIGKGKDWPDPEQRWRAGDVKWRSVDGHGKITLATFDRYSRTTNYRPGGWTDPPRYVFPQIESGL